MNYGTIKVDQITFTNAGVDDTLTVSGIMQSMSGSMTVTGTVQGETIIGTSTVSGATVTGNIGQFTVITGGSAGFTTITGTTVTGSIANFVSGVFSAEVSGTTVRGTTVSGTTVTGNVGSFTTITGGTVTLTSGVFASGTAALPSISFNGDPNTGIYSPGADQVALSTNGTGRLFVDASGNVSLIGTASITNATTDATNKLGRVFGKPYTNSDGDYLAFDIQGVPSENRIQYGGGSTIFKAATKHTFFTAADTTSTRGTERLVITSSGLVGVGTSSPDALLTVNGVGAFGAGSASAPSISFTGDLNTGIYSPGADQVAISTGGSGRLFVDASGRLSLGTSTATAQLFLEHPTVSDFRQSVNAVLQANIYSSSSDVNVFSVQANPLRFGTNNTERLRITSAGLVGIGTSSPSYALQVNGAIASVTGFGYLAALQTASGIGFRWTLNNDSTFRLQRTTDAFSSVTTPIFVDSSDRVGIGITSPGQKLRVVGDSGAAQFGAGTAGNAVFINAFDSDTVYMTASVSNATQFGFGSASNIPLFFMTNNTERARIDTSGRLLVGTSSARSGFYNGGLSSQIQLEGTAADSFLSLTRSSNNASSPVFILAKTRATSIGGNTVVANGDELGRISWQGADGTNLEESATIAAFVEGTPANNSIASRLVFSTTADGASSPTERMRIGNDGTANLNTGGGFVSVSTGTTDGITVYPPGTTGGVIQASNNNIVGYFRRRGSDGSVFDFRRDTTSVGTISVTTTATAYNTSSDYRLKENVTPVADGLTRLQQLKPSRFNFIADPTKTVDGFIAHEVQTVVPEAISGEKDAVDAEGNPIYQGIDQSKLVPLLTAALQEAVAKIETLEAKVAALESV